MAIPLYQRGDTCWKEMKKGSAKDSSPNGTTKGKSGTGRQSASPSGNRIVHNPFGTGQFDRTDMASVMAEVSGLRSKLQAKERENERLQADVERLSTRLDEAEDLRERCQTLENDNDILRKSSSELNTSTTHLRRQLEEANHERTRAELAATTATSNLSDTTADLRQAEQERDAAKRDFLNLRSEMTQSVSSLDRRLAAVTRERDHLKASLSAKQDELRITRERTVHHDSVAARDPRELQAAKQDVERLTDAAARAARQHADRIQALQAQIDGARAEVAAVRQSSMAEQQSLREKLNGMRQERDTAQSNIATLESDLTALKRRREEDLEAYARQCDATVRRNKTTFMAREAALKEQVQQLEGEMNVLRAHIAELERDAASQDVSALAKVRREAAEQLTELEQKLTRRAREADRRAEAAEADAEAARIAGAGKVKDSEAELQLARLRAAHSELLSQCTAGGFAKAGEWMERVLCGALQMDGGASTLLRRSSESTQRGGSAVRASPVASVPPREGWPKSVTVATAPAPKGAPLDGDEDDLPTASFGNVPPPRPAADSLKERSASATGSMFDAFRSGSIASHAHAHAHPQGHTHREAPVVDLPGPRDRVGSSAAFSSGGMWGGAQASGFDSRPAAFGVGSMMAGGLQGGGFGGFQGASMFGSQPFGGGFGQMSGF